jgi:thiol-disulfide isomerase/thioredoxin
MAIIEITNKAFEGSFLKSFQHDLVIILFKMDKCQYCIDFIPLYNQLSTDYRSYIIFTSINRDTNKELISGINKNIYGYTIESFPTIVIYKQGYFLTKFTEERTYDNLTKFLSEIITLNYNKKVFNSIIKNDAIEGGNNNIRGLIIIPYHKQYNNNADDTYLYLNKFFESNKINNFKIIILQSDSAIYNKSKLYNIGYNISEEFQNIDYLIFNDVDFLPNNNMLKYYTDFPDKPRNITNVLYNRFINNLLVISKKDLKKINGFSNNYINQDNIIHSIYERMNNNNICITEKYLSLKYPISKSNVYIVNKNFNNYTDDGSGINNLEYNLINIKKMSNNIFIYEIII